MEELEGGLNFVKDLAIILVSAGVFTLVSKALRQPLILGYIIAGFLAGPKFGLFPTVTSVEAVDQWSEIGMIFLMFALGLEFSFKKLISVGSSAILTAGIKFIGMFILGMAVGAAIGWTFMESIFLGGLLSMASTAVVIKAYDEMDLKGKPYASLTFGTLVVEDLIAILLMVLLSTMAVSNRFAGMEMVANLLKLVFFLILWFLVGIYVIPSLLKKAEKFLNDEILLIVSIGLCFAMVTLANLSGFSSALGAFVMGSLLAETMQGERIEKLVLNIKNLFGAIFFVSVGMMIDPAVIMEHWVVILLLVIVVIAGHFIFAAWGTVLVGKGLENAVYVGCSLSQLGEFAFIITSLGTTLGVMRGFTYPIIIAVSVITTFTTPYVIKLAGPISDFLHKKLPPSALALMNPKPYNENELATNLEHEAWKSLIKSYVLRIVLYGVMAIAVFLVMHEYVKPLAFRMLSDLPAVWTELLFTAASIAALLPFLYGMTANSHNLSQKARFLLKQRRANTWPIVSLMFIRIFLAMSFLVVTMVTNLHAGYWNMLIILGVCGFFFWGARGSMHKFSRIEQRFLANLNAREAEQRRRSPVKTTVYDRLSGYDVHIESMDIPANSSLVGLKIKETPVRAESGVNILKIRRGNRNIIVPNGYEILYPHDTLVVVGTTEQLHRFRILMEREAGGGLPADDELFDVRRYIITDSSRFNGRSLDGVDIRANNCMLISVYREGRMITNPRADFLFRTGDQLWLAGTEEGLEKLLGH